MERRQGGELGVRWVESIPVNSLGRLIKQGTIPTELLDAGLRSSGTDRQTVLDNPPQDGAIFLIQYADDLLVPVLMLPGRAKGISVAFRERIGPVRATRAGRSGPNLGIRISPTCLKGSSK